LIVVHGSGDHHSMVEPSQLPSGGNATAALEPGQRLGKYEVIERLATGGMAEIVLARASGMLGFQKLVVIKRILPHLASRNDFIQMFLDEARIATTLNHPNVVQTYEVGVQGKSYFLVMEYLAGEDVRSIVRKLARQGKRLPVEHALQVIIGVTSGLQYAHDKRDFDGKPLDIVHRDVTPQNVIVSYDGGVKLLDFGIAKASNRINETRSGSFKGKVPYLSPEQCRGEPLDRRTDIFSLGILLYEITLGRRLFRGETDFQILKQIADGAVTPPRVVDPGYDPRLEQIVMKALDNDPARRFQSAREMQDALERLAHDQRLRLSPLALSDFMHALFADKVHKWQQVSAEGGREQLEQHFADLAAEREADLQAEEALSSAGSGGTSVEQLTPAGIVPQLEGDSPQLLPLPADESSPRPRLWPWLLVGMIVAAGVTSGVLFRARLSRQPASAPTVSAPAPAMPRELPAPQVDEAPALTTATVVVNTTPPGATLILDGKVLPEKSPARIDAVQAGNEHVLAVELHGFTGVAQRFQLNGGEEATLEIDLRKNGHGTVRHSHKDATAAVGKPIAATPAKPIADKTRAGVAAKPAALAPVAPAVKAGEGTIVVASSPWCNVSIDGKPQGTTPISVKVAAGAHEVTLTNNEFHISRMLSVDVDAGQTVRKKLDFAPSDE
jgi:serine/threonine-protein kinase